MTQVGDGLAKGVLQAPRDPALARAAEVNVNHLAAVLMRMTLTTIVIAVMVVMLWAIGVTVTESDRRPFAAFSPLALVLPAALAFGVFFGLFALRKSQPAWALVFHVVVLVLTTDFIARQVVSRGVDLLTPWYGWAWPLYGMLLANTVAAACLLWPHRARWWHKWWQAAGGLALVAMLAFLGGRNLVQAAPDQATQASWALKFTGLVLACLAVYVASALRVQAGLQGQSSVWARTRLLYIAFASAVGYVIIAILILIAIPAPAAFVAPLWQATLVGSAGLTLVSLGFLFIRQLVHRAFLLALTTALVSVLALGLVGDALAPALAVLAMVLLVLPGVWVARSVLLAVGLLALWTGGDSFSKEALWFFGCSAMTALGLLGHHLAALDHVAVRAKDGQAQAPADWANKNRWHAAVLSAILVAALGTTSVLTAARNAAITRAENSELFANASLAEAVKELRHITLATEMAALEIADLRGRKDAISR